MRTILLQIPCTPAPLHPCHQFTNTSRDQHSDAAVQAPILCFEMASSNYHNQAEIGGESGDPSSTVHMCASPETSPASAQLGSASSDDTPHKVPMTAGTKSESSSQTPSSEEVEKKMPREICMICRDPDSSISLREAVPCGHQFHENCILEVSNPSYFFFVVKQV